EFHEIAGRSFAALLAQSGKFGLTLIMANQTTSQLENRDTSLAQVVFDNTHVKQYFTVTTEEDIRQLQLLSKERKVLIEGWSSGPDPSRTVTAHAVLLPRLRHNRILETSSRFGHSFLVLDDGDGHHEPIRIYREHQVP